MTLHKNTVRKTFPVLKLHCASCAQRTESLLNRQKGVVNASVNYANAHALVEYQPG
ncbi:MAG: cation transporter, partial [Mediterranea sp.]|nr:cation transporter [Mediterranea sp.]